MSQFSFQFLIWILLSLVSNLLAQPDRLELRYHNDVNASSSALEMARHWPLFHPTQDGMEKALEEAFPLHVSISKFTNTFIMLENREMLAS